MLKKNKCHFILLGIITIQFYLSFPIYADDAAIAQRDIAIAHIRNADYLSAQTAFELYLTKHCFPAALRKPQMKPIISTCIENNCRQDFINAGENKLKSADNDTAINILTTQAIAYAYFKDIPSSLQKLHQLRSRYSSHDKLPEYLLNISIEYFAAGVQADSIQLAEEIVEKYPKHRIVPDALTLLAINYFKMESMPISKQMLNQLRSRYSSHEKFPKYLFDISEAYWTIKTRPESIKLAEEIVEKYPHHAAVPDALNELAIRYPYVDQDSASRDALQQLRTKYSSHEKFPDYLLYISRWYRGQESLQMQEEILEKYPDHKAAMGALRELICKYPNLGQTEKANKLLHQLRSQYGTHPGYPGCLRVISKRYWVRKAKDESVKLLEESIDKFPGNRGTPYSFRELIKIHIYMENWPASIKRADQLLSQYMYYEQVPDILKTINWLYKKRADDIETKSWLKNRLTSLIHDGEDNTVKKQAAKLCIMVFDEQTAFETIVGGAESNFIKNYTADDMREMLSHCQENNRFSLAVKLCQEYLKGKPQEQDRKNVELLLFTNWFYSGDDPMSLLPHLDKYIQGNNSNDKALTAQAIILKGRITMQSGNADDAIKMFKMAIDQYPDNTEIPEGHFLLGYCYLLQNEFDRAREIFDQYINKYPADINVSQAKKLIKRINDLTAL